MCAFDVCQASKPFPSINYGPMINLSGLLEDWGVDKMWGRLRPTLWPTIWPTLWPTGEQIFKNINTTFLSVERVRWYKLLSLEKATITIFNVRENEIVQILQHSALKLPISPCHRRIPQPERERANNAWSLRICKMAAPPSPYNTWTTRTASVNT